jgi:hypothetical protein
MLTVAQLAPLKDRDPYLYETLTKIVSAVNSASQAAGVDSSTPSPAPTPVVSISVQASNGWFDVAITDPSDARPGLFYFAESDTTPSFSAPRVYFLGASRNLYVQLGNQTLYWRAFSQYLGSMPSASRTFGAPRPPLSAAARAAQPRNPQREAARCPTVNCAAATASASIPAPASQNHQPSDISKVAATAPCSRDRFSDRGF